MLEDFRGKMKLIELCRKDESIQVYILAMPTFFLLFLLCAFVLFLVLLLC